MRNPKTAAVLLTFCIVSVEDTWSQTLRLTSEMHQESDSAIRAIDPGLDSDHALVITNTQTLADLDGVIADIRRSGGSVSLVLGEHGLVAHLPGKAFDSVLSHGHVRLATKTTVSPNHPALSGLNQQDMLAVEYHNYIRSGQLARDLARGATVVGEPLVGDAITGAQAELRAQTIGQRAILSHKGIKLENTSPPWDNPRMAGRIKILVDAIQSNSTIYPYQNYYTWTQADINLAANQMLFSCDWWSQQASARGITATFYIEFNWPTNSDEQTGYEPIRWAANQDYLWVYQIMSAKGYTPATYDRNGVINAVENHNLVIKHSHPEFGWTPFDAINQVFLIYNPPGAPQDFSDGGRAFTFWGGPYTVMMYNSDGWGPYNMGLVYSHENGHSFWACDEYYDTGSAQGCNTCSQCSYTGVTGFNYGPRWDYTNNTSLVPNSNCAYPACNPSSVNCMMKNSTYALCSSTPAQIGW